MRSAGSISAADGRTLDDRLIAQAFRTCGSDRRDDMVLSSREREIDLERQERARIGRKWDRYDVRVSRIISFAIEISSFAAIRKLFEGRMRISIDIPSRSYL